MRSERTKAWPKVKTILKGRFPVVGGRGALSYETSGQRAALTDWIRTASAQIRKQLDMVVISKSKLRKPVRKPKATWVEPKFLAYIESRDITSEGLLRGPPSKAGAVLTPNLPNDYCSLACHLCLYLP